MKRGLALLASFLLCLPLSGCEGSGNQDSASEGGGGGGSLSTTPSLPLPEQFFDREFVFLSRVADSTLYLPWLFRTRVSSDGVQREIQTRIVRGGTWESLSDERNDTLSFRIPERILPSEKVRFLAGSDNQIEALLFRDPPREVETQLLEILAEWPRPGGESIFLYRGRSILPSGATEGVVLDLARRWSLPTSAVGDWIFLAGEGGIQLFLEEVLPIQESRGSTRYRGWIRSDPSAGPWTSVFVRWEEMRPYERARRDIPARWTLSTPGEDLSGELTLVSSHLAVVEASGPVLPVMGLLQVEGRVRIQERDVRVAGLVRHQQY